MALRTNVYSKILDYFPEVKYAIAYGSGVIPQKGYDYTNTSAAPMIDFVFAVDNAELWHKENLSRNKDHYSALAFGGPKFVANIQNNYGAYIYYNPFVSIEGQQIKYGVIQQDKLCKDLTQWETFYVSGRMQKPIKVIRDDSTVTHCNSTNLTNAIRAALLLLPQSFTEEELYTQVAGLSYLGDIRMQLGENPHKIKNIVSVNVPGFRTIYQGVLQSQFQDHFDNIPPNFEGTFVQKDNNQSRLSLISTLPPLVVQNMTTSLAPKLNLAANSKDMDILQHIVEHRMMREAVIAGISPITNKYSKSQSIKGIFTSGLIKSVYYAMKKLKSAKRW